MSTPLRRNPEKRQAALAAAAARLEPAPAPPSPLKSFESPDGPCQSVPSVALAFTLSRSEIESVQRVVDRALSQGMDVVTHNYFETVIVDPAKVEIHLGEGYGDIVLHDPVLLLGDPEFPEVTARGLEDRIQGVCLFAYEDRAGQMFEAKASQFALDLSGDAAEGAAESAIPSFDLVS